jgi:septal ring factor EnvC (AmiA/AmiB activator)
MQKENKRIGVVKLSQFETQVSALLDRLNQFKDENKQLKSELAASQSHIKHMQLTLQDTAAVVTSVIDLLHGGRENE